MDETEAIKLLKRGDIRGLEALVYQYQLRAIRAAYLITGDRSSAEDIVQSAFLRIYERIDQFDQSKSFGPWFLRSVVNDAIKATARRQSISLDAEPEGESTIIALLDNDNAADALDRKDLHDKVWAALESLPPAQRAVIVLRYYLDLSEQEMAAELNTAPGTIKWRLHAARKQLQVLLRSIQWMGGIL